MAESTTTPQNAARRLLDAFNTARDNGYLVPHTGITPRLEDVNSTAYDAAVAILSYGSTENTPERFDFRRKQETHNFPSIIERETQRRR